MKVIKTAIDDVLIIETDCFGDNRGYFTEEYNKQRYLDFGIDCEFVQDNMSFSAQKGVLRGLHYQKYPYSQSKLVYCSKGVVVDVAVDIRKGSPTYGKYVAVELSSENKRQLFIPKGFAHGFVTLTDDVEFRYKCDDFYNKESEGGIIYNDPTINIDWNSIIEGFEPILSSKDREAPNLKECNANFIYKVNC